MARMGASIFLALHGLIHWMGFFVYLQLAKIEGLPYQTSLLNGFLNVGERGMVLFGILWAGAGFLFIGLGLAWMIRKTIPRHLFLGTVLFSLLITVLDYSNSYAGVVINLVILALMILKPLWACDQREQTGNHGPDQPSAA